MLRRQAADADEACAMLQAGDARLTDTRQDEQDRCITIKSTGGESYEAYWASCCLHAPCTPAAYSPHEMQWDPICSAAGISDRQL